MPPRALYNMISFTFLVVIIITTLPYRSTFQPRWTVCIVEPNPLLFFSFPLVLNFTAHIYGLVQNAPSLCQITAQEQMMSFTKQVIGWHLKGWNGDACVKQALSRVVKLDVFSTCPISLDLISPSPSNQPLRGEYSFL